MRRLMQEGRAGLAAPTHLSAFVALVGLLAASSFGALGCGDKGTNPKDSIPPARVTDLEVLVAMDHSVTLSWTAPGDDGSDGRASEYDIRFDTGPLDQSWDTATKVDWASRPGEGGEREEAVIEGLAPQTSYYFALRTADEVPNWSATVSNVVATATGRDSIPPASIVDFAVASVGPTSVELTWTAPKDNWTPGTIGSYDIRFAMYGLTADSWVLAAHAGGAPTPQPPGSTERAVVSPLAAGTPYALALKAVDAWGNVSAISNIITVTTSGDTTAPGNVTDLTATPVSASAVRLTWTAPGNDGVEGTAASYDVRYMDHGITEESWADAPPVLEVPKPKAPGSTETLVVGGLGDATAYFFALKTADAVLNRSGLSNIATATTEMDTEAPGEVTDLSVEAAGTTAVTLAWTAPGDDGAEGRAASYDLRYSTAPLTDLTWDSATPVGGGPEPSAGGSPEQAVVNTLAQRTQYHLALKTVDNRGNWSQISNVVTAALQADPNWTWHIYPDGSGDAPTIQAAIDRAYDGDTVLVYPGRYVEHLDFLGKRLVLISTGGADATILDGSRSPGTVVTLTHWEPEGTVLQGFTITGGSTNGGGGGIHIGGSSPLIQQNVIVGNHGNEGGAILIHTSNASYAVIRSNRIEKNSCDGSGGAMMVWQSGVVVIDNVFSENVTGMGDGAAIYLQLDTNRPDDRAVIIRGNAFLHNEAGDKGGAILLFSPGSPSTTIDRNVFAWNSGGFRERDDWGGTGGGIFAYEARASITHNTFYANDATFRSNCGGGGIAAHTSWSPGGGPEIRFNIFAENQGCGASCRFVDEASLIGPNLFWQNTDADIGTGLRTCPQVWFDTAVMADPLFCDPANGDFRLSENSPGLTDERGTFGAFSTAGCVEAHAGKATWGRLDGRYR